MFSHFSENVYDEFGVVSVVFAWTGFWGWFQELVFLHSFDLCVGRAKNAADI